MKYYYLLAALAFTGIIACSGEKNEENEAEESLETILPEMTNEVTVMTLRYTNFNHEVISNGKLASRKSADLRFESSDPIAAIHVKNGDRVKKGQKLAELATFRLDNNLTQNKSSLDAKKLELQDLLIGQGYMIEDSLKVPAATMELVRVRSGYDQSLSQYELSLYERERAVLTAPFDGIVANLFDKEYNSASTSEVFCTIIDPSSLEATFTVLESELGLIKVGDRVSVTPFSMPGVHSEGRLSEINPLVDENGMVKVKATVQNSGRLYEGMNVRVSIQRSVPNQLVVPKEAVVLRSGRQVVFTLNGDQAHWNYVFTSLENSEHYTLVDDGVVKEGDIVITSGNINLAHESPVIVVEKNN